MTVPVCDPVLLEDEVELVDGGDEDDGVDGLEAVEPLSPLRSLPAHVDQIQAQTVNFERHVNDACIHTKQNISFSRLLTGTLT